MLYDDPNLDWDAVLLVVLADFSISFARRSSLTSRRNARISSRSWVLSNSPAYRHQPRPA